MTEATQTCTGVEALGWCLPGDPALVAIYTVVMPSALAFFLRALGGPKWRARVRMWLYGGRWSDAYAGLLDGTLARLDRAFGPPLGARALAVCFRLAVLYAPCLWILQVALTDPSGGAGERAAVAAVMFLSTFLPAFSACRWVARRHAAARAGAGRARAARLTAQELVLTAAAGAAAALVGFGPAVVLLGLASGWDRLDALLDPASMAAGAGLIAGVGTTIGIGAAGLAAALAAASLAVGAVAPAASVVVMIGLPMINALFDLPSWAASRWLMARLLADARGPRLAARLGALAAHAAADVGLALVCMFGLAAALANALHAVEGDGSWQDLAAAAGDPFGGPGLAMTVMLLSTLAPTALHLFFAVFALATLRPPFAARTAFWIQEDQEAEEKATQWLVATYLSVCAGFAALVLWGAGRLALFALDGLVGGAGIWPWIFAAAERAVIF
ncbi:hypothetical protein ACQ5SO_07065 [Rhodovulum sp. DZ06]|uniref:hypothetical protein n=1 Tax=Rhodovulum sp. DZ06 TaxID=3425126 RepID=UPI003D34F364